MTVDELDRRLLAVQGIVVLGRGPSALELADRIDPTYAVCVTHPTFATKDVFAGPPDVVLFGDQEPLMAEAAARFRGVSASERPVLVSHHMPNPQLIRTARYQSLNIPVPLPVVPRLAAQGLYQPTNDGRYPTSGVFLALLAASYDKPVVLAGVDLYRHPSGSVYVTSAPQTQFKWPAQHSEALDVTCLRTVAARLGSKLTCLGVAAEVVSRA